jgi:hypothetical protein
MNIQSLLIITQNSYSGFQNSRTVPIDQLLEAYLPHRQILKKALPLLSKHALFTAPMEILYMYSLL